MIMYEVAAAHYLGSPNPYFRNFDGVVVRSDAAKILTDALFEFSRTKIAMSVEDYNSLDPSARAGLVGYLTDGTEEIPEPRRLSLKKRYRNDGLDAKAFREAKSAGLIVFNAIANIDVSVQQDPMVFSAPPVSINRLDAGLKPPSSTGYIQPPFSGPATDCLTGWNSGLCRYPYSDSLWHSGPPNVVPAWFKLEHAYFGFDETVRLHSILNLATISRLEVNKGLVTALKAEANRGVYDLATELAEMPETVSMIYKSIRALILKYLETKRKIKTLRANNISSGSLSHDIAGLWMAFRYGMMPIAYSIQDGLELLDTQIVKFRTFRQGRTGEYPDLHVEGYSTVSKPAVIERCVIKHKYRAGSSTFAQSVGFDPIASAWEVVPLSFVIDWVFNIGDLLASIGLSSAVEQEEAWYSWRITGEYVFRHEQTGALLTFKVNNYEGIPLKVQSHLGLSIDPFLNIKRSLDALSLSWLLFKKKGR